MQMHDTSSIVRHYLSTGAIQVTVAAQDRVLVLVLCVFVLPALALSGLGLPARGAKEIIHAQECQVTEALLLQPFGAPVRKSVAHAFSRLVAGSP